jgi:diguanylate cyclase (GGDEF)-like protein
MAAALSSRLATLILGPAGRRRVRVAPTLLSLAAYAALAVLQHAEVMAGLIDPLASKLQMLFCLSGAIGFYVLVRSGASERLADPAMTAPQMAWALVGAAGAYAITGPARGAVMTLMVLTLVFGMFALSPRAARALALAAFALLSAVMLWKSRSDPLRYPPLVEAVHFVFGVIVLSGVSALSIRMGAMRARLKAQKCELERALEQIRQLATQDELTGLYNRRHMSALLEQARQGAAPVFLVLMDLDLFKRINDTHGHQAGDAVLRRFAATGRAALRSSDVLARWGGEEFLLMLPGATHEQALQVVARLRTRLAEVSFDDIAPGLQVTFSAGLSRCTGEQTLEAALERADQAMYRAKTGGRNRTVTA